MSSCHSDKCLAQGEEKKRKRNPSAQVIVAVLMLHEKKPGRLISVDDVRIKNIMETLLLAQRASQ